MSIRHQIRERLLAFEAIITTAVMKGLIQHLLTREGIVNALNGLFDFLQEFAERTSTPVDDLILKAIRDALDLPDAQDPPADSAPPAQATDDQLLTTLPVHPHLCPACDQPLVAIGGTPRHPHKYRCGHSKDHTSKAGYDFEVKPDGTPVI